MKSRYLHLFLALCCAAIVLTGASFAQTAAVLHGRVADETGAGISEARLTLTAADGRQQRVVAAADGEFTFLNLASGEYSLMV